VSILQLNFTGTNKPRQEKNRLYSSSLTPIETELLKALFKAFTDYCLNYKDVFITLKGTP
jgi:hypothetical protein